MNSQWNLDWRYAVGAGALLSLGVGGATLAYRRYRRQQARQADLGLATALQTGSQEPPQASHTGPVQPGGARFSRKKTKKEETKEPQSADSTYSTSTSDKVGIVVISLLLYVLVSLWLLAHRSHCSADSTQIFSAATTQCRQG